MKISAKGLDFVKSFESFVPHVYDDLVPPVRGKYREWQGEPVRGTLTIGYGHTDAARHPLKIKQGLRITEAEAAEVLDVDLDECEADVNRLVRVKLLQGEFDALTSFTFNCGSGNLKKLIGPLNAGNYDACRAAFDHYIRSKGQVLRGLQRRRDGEQAMWDEVDAPLPVEPVHHPAEVDTPEHTPPETMAQSSTGNTAVVLGGGGATTVATEMSNAATKVAASGKAFTLADFVLALATSPTFWIGVLTTAGAAYIWLERRRKLITHGI